MSATRQSRRFVPLLIDVERRLDEEINLDSLATQFGSSAFHFHRLFSASIGETPKKHVERLRLEKAAYRIAVSDDSVLDIALAVGFKSAETFSRNFKKFTGYTPSGYRRMAKLAQAARVEHTNFHDSDAYTLSRARFEPLPAMLLLAIRKMGGYGEFHETFEQDDHLWNQLIRWAHAAGIPIGPAMIGIYYDDPTMTPKPLQRYDVCVPVARTVAGTQTIRCIPFQGGLYGIVEYVGRTDTVINAFQGLADEIRRSGTYAFRDQPSIEIVRQLNVNGEVGVHWIDACFAVEKTGKRRR